MKLGYSKNLQTCQSVNCSCYGAWDEWLPFLFCDHLYYAKHFCHV